MPRDVAVRRPRGQPSWHREPSGHEYIENAAQSSARRASRADGRVARNMATEGFRVVNSQEGGSQRMETVGRGRGRGGRGGGSAGGVGSMQAYENVIDFSA